MLRRVHAAHYTGNGQCFDVPEGLFHASPEIAVGQRFHGQNTDPVREGVRHDLHLYLGKVESVEVIEMSHEEVEGILIQSPEESASVAVARDAGEPYEPLGLRPFESFQSSVGRDYLLPIAVFGHRVEKEYIDMVSSQSFQAFHQLPLRTFEGPLARFGGDDNAFFGKKAREFSFRIAVAVRSGRFEVVSSGV